MAQENDKYRRISKMSAASMVMLAIFFDLMEFLFDLLPFVGVVLAYIPDIFALISFSIWFMASNIKLSSPKSGGKFWVSSIGELLPIPVIDFCLTTIGVILTIRQTWKEDSGDTSGDLADVAKIGKAVITKKV